MNEPAQGSVVLVDFTYSNQVQSKVRPALVMSNSRYNTSSRDVIVMKITSRKPKIMAVGLTNDDLLAGSLDHPSFIQVDGIYALEKTLICNTIGVVRPEKMIEIRTLVSDLFAPDSG
ncbi:type II toxin-antitoxin system PemK/MazF family toxin [Methanoregula sp.]|uniref:type II toxin-antitoxin system PemK/MazF family toxin n=1 Tax=Methanoregula sp. TaxID=2052170 RepID=UPI00236BC1AD|nr:type II toxin-antitoxin system PemK/MazF family toxin [Methanoregula sp.]MDD1685888.1 type II toxin-antitoxin system PemK/MazF family toxin [Methanoregula sp.]